MTATPIAAVILAAGKGTRVSLHKVLHPLAGRPMLGHLLAEVRNNNRKGECSLTDIVALAQAKSERATTTEAGEYEVTGANFQEKLAALKQQPAHKSGVDT